MEHSFRYFSNTQCEYFPCHRQGSGEAFNCLFCYCPMYPYGDCPGTPSYITSESGVRIKDCSYCRFPHEPENYDKVMEFLREKM